MGIGVRLDLEALAELRLQECVESVLPAPRRINRSSHGFFGSRRGTGPGVDLCLPPLHASRADARWRFRAFGRRFRLQGQWTECTPLLDARLRATRDFTRAKNDVRLWLRRCEDVQGEERADDVL